MTAEPDLLPLPRTLADWIAERCEDALDAGDVTDFVETYARANLAHVTAVKDAEIARWKETAEWQSDITKALLPYQDEAIAGRAKIEALRAELGEMRRTMADEFKRAERLAGALQERLDWFEAQAKSISKGNGSSWDLMQVREQRDLCKTALDQERP